MEGFTLVEIMIVVAIIGVLSMIAVPHFWRATETARASACKANQRVIIQAKEEWALENYEGPDASPMFAELDPYIKGGHDAIVCPKDPAETFETSYLMGNMSTYPGCLIEPVKHSPD
ncbi:MAG: prepilin-type N-terminal cleavage/methylation domain-containing protein [Kiritimatiellae bacterium]|nr:prepilin-type N-terminal cleavage/methylation domain-containing protein [Kiritimatiellia bacterium]